MPFVQVTRVDPADDYYLGAREDLGTGGEFRFKFLDTDSDLVSSNGQVVWMGPPVHPPELAERITL